MCKIFKSLEGRAFLPFLFLPYIPGCVYIIRGLSNLFQL